MSLGVVSLRVAIDVRTRSRWAQMATGFVVFTAAPLMLNKNKGWVS